MIGSIAQLPFHRCETLAMLHLDVDRDAVDADYTGFGHSRVEAITLAGRGDAITVVRDALVLALHCADPCERLADDVELEFILDDIVPALSATTLLSRFLAVWLPTLSSDEGAIVLALCNPHFATVPRPAAFASVTPPLYYAVGDVESWYDGGVRLVAPEWRIAR